MSKSREVRFVLIGGGQQEVIAAGAGQQKNSSNESSDKEPDLSLFWEASDGWQEEEIWVRGEVMGSS